jgi:hypothetical protein
MAGVFQNIDPPTPSPPGECEPPAFGAGGRTHWLGGEGGGGSIIILEDARHSSVLYIRKYFVPQIIVAQPSPNDFTKPVLSAAGATTVKSREMVWFG